MTTQRGHIKRVPRQHGIERFSDWNCAVGRKRKRREARTIAVNESDHLTGTLVSLSDNTSESTHSLCQLSARKVQNLSPKKHGTGHIPNNGFRASGREPHLQISFEYGRLETCRRPNKTPKHPPSGEQENIVGGEKRVKKRNLKRRGEEADLTRPPRAPFIPPDGSRQRLGSRPLLTQEPDRR